MGRRGYAVARAGTNAHLLTLLMRAPGGLSANRAKELGLLSRGSTFAYFREKLENEYGYETKVVREEPTGGRGRRRHWVAVTARYGWDGSVMEDYVAERVKRGA